MLCRKSLFKISVILLTVVFLASCSTKIKGVIVEVVDESNVYVADNMTPEQYVEIKDQETNDLIEAHVPLIKVHYTGGDQAFENGDYVNVWIDGDILTSYPAQATTKKVEIIE